MDLKIKNRTYVAALRAQRRIARQTSRPSLEYDDISNLSQSSKTSDKKNQHTNHDAGDIKQAQKTAGLIQKLRDLAESQDPASTEADTEAAREYMGLQDEIYRIAHTIDKNAKWIEHSNYEDSFVEIREDYGNNSFSFEEQQSSKVIRIDLNEDKGFSAKEFPHQASKEPPQEPIYRLDNALFDLNSYREYIGNLNQKARDAKPQKRQIDQDLDFSKESASFIHETLRCPVESRDGNGTEKPTDLALSLLNNT
ncbi:hypothetical protein [Pseudobacteriovorax antillogorgiicola]|uniref:Uncharacterized protein n=1 Tax=Pseudobacteriovorax antillogorgiicola TaxID=1513793 RepID=A0A1Y6C1L8_9BACT|nr:hypothetical protein [Pseudobacteriovorax antillogorgiicola]TCS50718.1 hypothetical protein EDD56_112101 [Pseudobacteriovorax antillogorgiicola]SMF40691.1 hypothetical protein SAMN06296036_112100 [Pseudobacteriovorax antillogorgiicola]